MSLEDELKGADRCEHGISTSTFGSTKQRSAYGTRTVTREDWENQDSSIQAGNSCPGTSNQNADTGTTTSEIANQHESRNGSDLIHLSRLHISDGPNINIAVDNVQSNGQSNIGFNTDF